MSKKTEDAAPQDGIRELSLHEYELVAGGDGDGGDGGGDGGDDNDGGDGGGGEGISSFGGGGSIAGGQPSGQGYHS